MAVAAADVLRDTSPGVIITFFFSFQHLLLILPVLSFLLSTFFLPVVLSLQYSLIHSSASIPTAMVMFSSGSFFFFFYLSSQEVPNSFLLLEDC